MILKVLKNGPILVITDATETVMALCRCGNSKNNPHCDGSHKYCDFRADGDVFVIEDGKLVVTNE